MDYKEKYELTLKKAKGVYNSAKSDKENGVSDKITEYTIQLMETIFPELKEPKEEMIKKALIHLISEQVGFLTAIDGVSVKDAIVWLEKQGEQKPVWSENDKKMLNQIISIIEDADDNLVRPENISIYINWLKSKTQSQLKWKPSELQIEALESATENCAYSEYQDCLKELIVELKKLIE